MNKLYFLLLLITGMAFAAPPIGTPNNLQACDNNNDGFEAFDLTVNSAVVLGALNPSLYNVSYHVTNADANNNAGQITTPTSFVSSGQVVYVRVEEIADPTNFAVAGFTLIVNDMPVVVISGGGTICYGYDSSVIFNGTPNAVVTYTVDSGAPQTIVLNFNGVAVVVVPQPTSTIYQLISVSLGNCSQAANGVVIISALTPPTATIVTPSQTFCSGNAVVAFQASSSIAPYVITYTINGGAAQTLVTDSSGLANLTLPAVDGVYNVALVGVTASTECFTYLSENVQFVVGNPISNITPHDLYVVDDPYDGVANFNLTLNTPLLMNGDPSLNITYYNTLADAELSTLSIINTTSYSGTNGQKVWVRIQNPQGCFVIKSFRLFTTNPNAPNDFIFIPDANFKSALITIGVDTNNDGQIQYLEAAAVTQLTFFSNLGITDLTGINYFTNLTSANFNGNHIFGVLDITNLVNLTSFECNGNELTGLLLPATETLTQLFCGQNDITSLDLSQAVGLQTLYCSFNQISSLILTPSLVTLSCDNNNLTTMDITDLSNLEYIQCSGNNNLTFFTAAGLTSLTSLTCNNNPALLSIDVSGCIGLESLTTTGNSALNSLDISGCINMTYLDCANGQLTTLDASNLPLLARIKCNNNQLTSLNISGCPIIEQLTCNNNQLTAIDLSGTSILEVLMANNNLFNTLTVTNQPNLTGFNCNDNPNLTSLNLSGCTALPALYLYQLGQLASLNLSGCTAMTALQCGQNALTSLDVSGMTSLMNLECQNNQIATLNLTNCSSLQYLNCATNNLTVLDVSDSTQLINLDCTENSLAALDVSNLTSLVNLYCSANALTTLDVSNSPNLSILNCSVNNLVSLFVKNGANESVGFYSNPDLVYICADEFQINGFLAAVAQNQMNTQVNSYCTFNPGGNYNTITGNISFDGNNNGCGSEDTPQPFIRVNITDNSSTGATFTNNAANYGFYTGEGSYTISAQLENASWFTVSPVNPVINFTNTNNNVVTQNFCIAPNGVHSDVEVVIAPVMPSRPGFNATYKVVFKNKGNQITSGNILFNFEDEFLNFISATVNPDAQSFGSLTWNYTNLLPFESRSFNVTFHVNAPTDTPPVNIGEVLNYSAVINPIVGDETVSDNTFHFNETVIGSYDPNDITCLEGGIVSPVEIGNYLHYMIRFENTGTAEAENIVVRTVVNPADFDINSLQLLNASHPVYAKITGNIVEFIFQNILLESGGHGNVLLKIKSKNTLQPGDMVNKQANIYFDYNFPVETNEAETVFQSLSNPEFEIDNSVSIYPNPSNGIVNIKSKFNIRSTQLFDVQGRLLQTNVANDTNTVIDLSSQSNGIYFVKVITDSGIKVEKIVRK